MENSKEDSFFGAAVWADARSCDVCFQNECSAFDPVSHGFVVVLKSPTSDFKEDCVSELRCLLADPVSRFICLCGGQCPVL